MKKALIYVSFLLVISSFSQGHSLWLSLKKYVLKPGMKTEFYVGYGHKYLSPQGLVINEEEKYKKMFKELVLLFPAGIKSELPLNSGAGIFKADKKGVYILCLKLERGPSEPYGPSGKYAKALVQVGNVGKGFSSSCGFRVELIPLDNPYELQAGQYLRVKVLFEGKPLSTFVYATYAGYKPVEDAFPVMTRSNDMGIARLKLSAAGEWMVFVSHKVDYSATLTFAVGKR